VLLDRAGLAGSATLRSSNMTNPLNQDQLSQIVQAVISALQVQGTASAKPSSAAAGNSLEAKDRALISGLKRKGIPVDQIVLMDRNDKSKPFTIKPFKQWMAEGRQVRKGEKSIRGLFHISQTDLIAKAQPKPAVTAEQKTLFERAKKVLKAKKAKAQPVA
jgi:hypothetical protein